MRNQPLMRLLFILLFLPLNFVLAQTWQIDSIDVGRKSGLVVDQSGNPIIAYMTETSNGYLRVAKWNGSSFDTTTVKNGYFYGPLDIALDNNDNPGIVMHDHYLHDGDLSYSRYDGMSWTSEGVNHLGHDGWDGDITFDDAGNPHIASIDPISPGSGAGIEYNYHNGSTWENEIIGSSSLQYKNAVSIALDSIEDPHISYYDDVNPKLIHAYKKSGSWTLEGVDSIGDPGRFSYLLLNDNSEPYISYINNTGADSAEVKLAYKSGSSWLYEVIDTMTNISWSSLARKSTALQFDLSGDIHIAYCDRNYVKIAHRTAPGIWAIDTIVDESASATVLGQQIDMVYFDENNIHLTYHEIRITGLNVVKYATTSPLTATNNSDGLFNHIQLMPTSSDQLIRITGDISSYTVLDLTGKTIVKNKGQNSIATAALTPGLYLVKIQTSSGKLVTRKFVRP